MAPSSLPYNNWRLLFEQREPLRVDPSRAALVVIDMQYYDAHPDFGMGRDAAALGDADAFRYYWQQVREIVPRISQLCGLAREASVRVIFSRIAALTESCDDIGLLYRLCNIRVPINSKESEILPELMPGPGDIILSKSSSSVFNSTAINQILRNLGIDTLVVCGVVTSGCVESSVRDAADLGYRVVLVSDACADLSPEIQQASLQNLDARFAQLRSTEEVAGLIGETSLVSRSPEVKVR